MPRVHPPRLQRFVKLVFINLAVTVVLLLVLEGIASVRSAHERARQAPHHKPATVAERLHTEYDPLLGWINRPGICISNFYGEGRDLSINAQRFRAHDGLDPLTTSATARLIVSGDSFTLGYGVDDQDTWVARWDQMEPGLEIVNMGQGGYGLDQAYLWYRRDGYQLPHQLHILAFITENYNRMGRDRFMGYGKPVVTARDGRLMVENVPPPRAHASSQAARGWGALIQNLDLAQSLSAGARQRAETRRTERADRVQESARLIFEDVHRLNQEAGRWGALVHLPIQSDYQDKASDRWRQWLKEEAQRSGWVFLDLVADLRKLPADEISGLFIQSDDGRFRGARGHYSEKGNLFIAEALRRHLAEYPEWAAGRATPRRPETAHRRRPPRRGRARGPAARPLLPATGRRPAVRAPRRAPSPVQ